jgi:hypothetical protein
MLDYQRKHGVENQCVTNTQFLYDQVKLFCTTCSITELKITATPVMCVSTYGGMVRVTMGHVVLVLSYPLCSFFPSASKEVLIDPSYTVFAQENKTYFHSVQTCVDYLNSAYPMLASPSKIEEIEETFALFVELASEINRGNLTVSSMTVYNAQAEYIDRIFTRKHLETIFV